MTLRLFAVHPPDDGNFCDDESLKKKKKNRRRPVNIYRYPVTCTHDNTVINT